MTSPADDAAGPGGLVMRLAGRMRHEAFAELEPYGISPHLARALSAIDHHRDHPLRLSRLADRLRVSPRAATEVVDALAERGLAERRPDPDDRRATVVVPTGSGQELARRIKANRVARGDRLFAMLDDDERDTLTRLLQKVADAEYPPE